MYSLFASIKVLFGKYDIVHYHAEGSCAMLWLPHLFHKKIVVTIHGLDWTRSKWGGFATKYIKHGEKCAVKYADKIIVLSKGIQEYFKETYNRETIFIPNGVEEHKIKEPKIIKEKYPEYLNEFEKIHKRTSAHMFNIFIMKKEILNDYCTWLFDILFELEKRVDETKYDKFNARFYGRISEILLDIYIYKNKLKFKEVNIMDMQNINWFNKVASFLKAKFFNKKYASSF